jgi:hypothetical protein
MNIKQDDTINSYFKKAKDSEKDFIRFIARIRPGLFGKIKGILIKENVATWNDVTDSAIIKIYENFDKIDIEKYKYISGYLYTIAGNEAKLYLRSKKEFPLTEGSIIAMEQMVDVPCDMEREIMLNELWKSIPGLLVEWVNEAKGKHTEQRILYSGMYFMIRIEGKRNKDVYTELGLTSNQGKMAMNTIDNWLKNRLTDCYL